MSHSYEEIDSDQKLLHAIDMYWDIRRLSVQVRVIRKDDEDHIHDIGRLENMPSVLQGSIDTPANQTSAQPSLETDSSIVEPQIQQISEVPWVLSILGFWCRKAQKSKCGGDRLAPCNRFISYQGWCWFCLAKKKRKKR